ncbi:MAG: hypothetical protein ACOCZA_03260 [Spirochaetota bacterium]
MRTTINIDDELYSIARSLAESRGISMGAAVSELMRRGVQSGTASYEQRSGFPVMQVSEEAAPITPEQVAQDEEEA